MRRWAIWDVSDRGPEISVVEADDVGGAWERYAGERPTYVDEETYHGHGGNFRIEGGDVVVSEVTTPEQVGILAQDLWRWWRDIWGGEDPPTDAIPPARYWPESLGPMPEEQRS